MGFQLSRASPFVDCVCIQDQIEYTPNSCSAYFTRTEMECIAGVQMLHSASSSIVLHKESADQVYRWCVSWRWIARHVPLLPRLPPFLPGSLTGKLSLLTTQASTQLQKCAKPLQSLQLASKQAPRQALQGKHVLQVGCGAGSMVFGMLDLYLHISLSLSVGLVIACAASCEGVICGSPLPFSPPASPNLIDA